MIDGSGRPARRGARRVVALAAAAAIGGVPLGCRSTAKPAPLGSAATSAVSSTAVDARTGPTVVQAQRMDSVRPTPPSAGEEYFGVQLDWSAATPASYAASLGRVPYDFGQFVSLPLSTADERRLDTAVSELAALHAKLFLTLEVPGGLGTVTPAVAQSIATDLARWNLQGVGIFVRFGQEMNGGWYPWAQQPVRYVAAFRLIASYVHRLAPGSVMVWSPNYGGGYPFAGEPYVAQPGTAAFQTLDTNHDGKLTMQDDPYGPYYPGDDAVDWVGLSLYHFGNRWPWGANDVPEPGKFVNQMTGSYDGDNGNDTAVPNFYAVWAVGHHKPMAISETAALYDGAQSGAGATELQVKRAWIDQVFNPSVRADFPALALIDWFEYRKTEGGISGVVDWRAVANPQIRSALQAALISGYVFSPSG